MSSIPCFGISWFLTANEPPAAQLIDGDGEKQDYATRRILIEGRNIHKAHAIIEARRRKETGGKAGERAASQLTPH